MKNSVGLVGLFAAAFFASRLFVATAHAQSATITVASIPTTVAGSSITVSYTVQNTGTSSRTFGVGAEIRQVSTVLADLGTRTTPTVAPGATATGSFTYTIPAGWSSGTYTARAAVWTGTPGSSTFLNSYDRNFTVNAQVTSATITVAAISTVVAGNSITVSYTVNNTGNYSRTFGIGAEIRQGASLLADLGTKTTSTVAAGGSATGSFTYTIPSGWSSGTYTARAAVWTGTPGSSTFLNSYDRDFTVQARVTSATISVGTISTVVAGNSITVNYTVNNTGNYNRTFGVGAEIRQGSSVLADLGAQTTSTISAGSSGSGSFTYTIPAGWSGGTYTARAIVWTGTPGSSTFLNNYDRNFTVQAQSISATISVATIGVVVAGNSVTVNYTVSNTGNTAWNFGVGAEIRQSSTVLADLGTQTTSSISPGGTGSGSFSYTIPSGWSGGTYTARAAVWTGTPGSSTFLNSFDRDFTVQQVPLTITGKLAYHSYSAYLAAPIDADDGHIFLFTLPNGALRRLTQGLPVQNAMNPHIAPDGSRIVFMAIPQGQTRDYNLLEIYLYDLAQEALTRLTTNGVPDEDAKFSPDGQKIVFKRSGQIWTMNADGSGISQLTSTAREKSGPCFSPDGSRIVFWYDSKSSADVGWMLANSPNSDTVLFGDANYQDMYPIYRDSDTILYSRWESADANPAPPNPSDDVYAYSISTGLKTKLGSTQFNLSNTEDADAFPVQSALVGFSSTRSVAGAKGSYDIYIGNPQTDAIYQLGGMNSPHQDLGGWYSPYSDARKMVVLNPASGAQLTSGSTAILTARGYSNGGVWSGATPKIVLQGPVNTEFTGLHDDGINGDQTAGDGIYSKSVTLPTQAGSYSVYASANITDNGITHEIRSANLNISLVALSAPSAIAATNVSASSFTANWNGSSGATGYRLDVSTSSTFGSFVGGYQDLEVGNALSQGVSGLSAGTTYYYRVRAYNIGGTSGNSGTITVITMPAAPTANAASSVTNTAFAANWSSTTGATGYRLDVSTSSTFASFVSGYQDLDVGNVASKTVSALTAGTTYYYRIRAYNAGGTSGNSGTITVATLPNPPVAPTASAATGVTNNAFTANWSIASGATGYRLDVSTNNTFASFVSGYQDLDVGNVTSKTVSGLNGSTAHYYRVRAYNTGGTGGNSGTITATTLPNPPPAPTANAATSITNTAFTANWSSASGATGYRLDVSTSSLFDSFVSGYQDLNVGNVLTKAVSGLSAGTIYYYRVRAFNTGGAGGNSGTITVVTVPPAPVVAAASSVASSGFTANWNSASGATGYRLDVATNSTFTSYVTGYQNLDVGNVLSRSVTNLIANKAYYYRVRAYNANGTSGNSGTNSVTTLPPAIVPTVQSNKLVLSWPTNDPAFKLFYATNLPAATWISNAVAPAIVSGRYTITNSMTNNARFYRLKK